MKCRICGKDAKLVLDLGHHPPSDAFLKEEDLNKPEITYPLQLFSCDECGLVQIGYVVDPSVLFTQDYPYTTGVNEGGIRHFHRFAWDVIDKLDIILDDFIVDIGGNDGTLLVPFTDLGCKVLNIDPSGVYSAVDLWKGFWCEGTATAVMHRHGKAKVILTTNCFAHVEDVHDFVKGVKILLEDDGVFIIESPSLDDMIKYTQFDQIYHEHLQYYSIKSIKYLMGMHDMEVFEVEHQEFHGGSNRYFIRGR